MARLSVFVLGPPQVTLDGQAVRNFEHDKVRALLFYLIIDADRPYRRDGLAGLLWPELPNAAARNNLRHALANLREVLHDRTTTVPFLLISRDTIQFNGASDHSLDVTSFTNLLARCEQHPHRHAQMCKACTERREQAVALYRGSFLEGFSLRDSVAFDEWVMLKREQLHILALHALMNVSTYYERRGAYELARQYVVRQLELEPLREQAHRQLMRVLALSGQRSAAIEQYERCRRILGNELGIEPEDETTALYEIIRDDVDKLVRGHRTEDQSALSTLPIAPTALIGRAEELAQLADLLVNPNCRLITLVGPGGIGKTRLALAAATEHATIFRHGAVFVPLVSVTAPAFLAHAILAACRVPLQGHVDPTAQLLSYLRERDVLLVPDNFEHLLPSVELVLDILQCAARITLLVTSRERLALQAEWLFDLEGLDYPVGQPADNIERYNAVQLFLQCARCIERHFSLTSGQAAAIVQICQLVEGMPLGIELAASAVRERSCQQIATALGADLQILTTRLRDVPERHRSIVATFEHSWRLLSAQEQRVLRRLAGFRSGFQEDAAASVAGATPSILWALKAKSLIRRSHAGRYDMHELVRQYAHDKLCEASEAEQTRERHLAYYLTLVEAIEPKLTRGDRDIWLERLELEHDNMRAALSWTQAVGTVGERSETGIDNPLPDFRFQTSDTHALGLRLAGALFWFWYRRAYWREGSTWLDTALSLSGEVRFTLARAKALFGAGALAWHQGEYRTAQMRLTESLTLFQELHDTAGSAWALTYLGQVAFQQGEYRTAQMRLTESLTLFQELHDTAGSAWALTNLGDVTLVQGDPVQARSMYMQSLMFYRELGDKAGIAWALHNLGDMLKSSPQESMSLLEESLALFRELNIKDGMAYVLSTLGEVTRVQNQCDRAMSLFKESLAIFQELGDMLGSAWVLTYLGRVAFTNGEYETAQARLTESLAIFREQRNKMGVAHVLFDLGYVAYMQGHYTRARTVLAESLTFFQEVGDTYFIARCLTGLAATAITNGCFLEAARLDGAADNLCDTIGKYHTPSDEHHRLIYERVATMIQTQLNESIFAAAWAEGRAMPRDEAIDFALASSLHN